MLKGMIVVMASKSAFYEMLRGKKDGKKVAIHRSTTCFDWLMANDRIWK